MFGPVTQVKFEPVTQVKFKPVTQVKFEVDLKEKCDGVNLTFRLPISNLYFKMEDKYEHLESKKKVH